jgi:hypothetical protein
MLKKMLVLGFLLPALGGCFFGGRGGREGGHSHHRESATVIPVNMDAPGLSPAFQSSVRIGTN